MKKVRFSEAQIIGVLEEAEAGMTVAEAQRLRALEAENARLKKLLAEKLLDIEALKDLLGRKW